MDGHDTIEVVLLVENAVCGAQSVAGISVEQSEIHLHHKEAVNAVIRIRLTNRCI